MIDKAEIISQPLSGQFTERIYDNQSAWNSQSWTWIKFTNSDLTEWCGQFRGFPRQVAVSKTHNSVLVLTSDYLFQLDRIKAEIMEFKDQPQYQNLTVTPNGDFILSDYYNFVKMTLKISEEIQIESPISMDMIKFKNWTENKLEFTCDEFINWDRHLVMELDSETDEIKIKSET
jgi:hypothetical protein